MQNRSDEIKEMEDLLIGVLNTSLSGLQVYRSIYDQDNNIVDFEWILVNDAVLKTWGKKREDVMGKTLLTVFPGVKKDGLMELYIRAAKGETLNFIQHYNHDNLDIWFKLNAIRFRDGFILSSEDITKEVLAEQALKKTNAELEKKVQERTAWLEKQKNEIYAVLEQTPAMIAILMGPDLVFELANPLYLKAIGKTSNIIGKSLLEILPEIKDQPILEILRNVYKTGERYIGKEILVKLDNGEGLLENHYFNFVYEPFRNSSGIIEGSLAHAVDVTEQVINKKKAEESEKSLQLAQQAGNIGTFEWILKTDEIKFTSQVEKIFGYKPGEWIGNYKNAIGLTHPDDRERILKESQEAIKLRKNLNIEHRIVKPDQSIAWVNSKAELIYNEQGEPEKMLGVIIDVTERKLAEEALLKNEQRFRAMFNQTSVGIALTDLSGKFLLVNDQYSDMLDRSKEDLYKATLFDITFSEDLPTNRLLLSEKIAKGESFTFENRYIKSDGSLIWVNINVSPVKNNEGDIEYIQGFCYDITERKNYEQVLRESEERFHNLADTAPIYMAMADETGNAVYFNKPWLDWTGRAMEELRGLGWLITLHPEDASKFEHDFKNAFTKQIPINEQYRFRRADGEYRWMLAVGAPRFTPDGRFVGYFGTYTDFHELKEAEQALESKNVELIRINNDLDNFIYTASHDLKSPISNLEGLLYALRENLSPEVSMNTETDHLLGMMEKSVLRFKNTIRDLTEISKVQKGQEEDVAEMNLAEIIEDVKLSIQDQITETNTVIETDFSDFDKIKFSKKNLQSIIYNLLSNAIKYRSPDRTPEITLSTEMADNFCILTVKDNGLGINKENRDKIFSMFKRLHDHVEGSGIGLYIVKRIIDNAGGKIEVESEPGKGTTFKVYFKN